MDTTDYENIWQKSLIHVTDKFALPSIVLQAGEAIIGTLGNFSVSGVISREQAHYPLL